MTSRRDFLGAALTAPALGLVPSSAAGQTTPARRELRVGTVTYNIAKDWDVPTIIKNLVEVGMDAVELRTTHAHGVELTLTSAQRAEVRKRFEDSPVRIGGLGTTCEYHAADAALLRKNIDETKAWVVLARELGCPERQSPAQRAARRCPGGAVARADREGAARVRGGRPAGRSADPGRGPRPRDRQAAAHPADSRSRREPSPRVGLLELEPGGPARRWTGAQLRTGQGQHRPDSHAGSATSRNIRGSASSACCRASISGATVSRNWGSRPPTGSGC